MPTLSFLANQPTDLQQIANEAVIWSAGVNQWLFDGVPGAGKTTFIQAICQALRTVDSVTSPTFSLLNQYKTADAKTIHHIDFYRLHSKEEAVRAGLDEAMDDADYCFVEWWKMFPELASDNRIEVEMNILPEGLRQIRLTKHEN
jgi:tRNA threonylcarbamoyladenosine biosynthesis protein TsaE